MYIVVLINLCFLGVGLQLGAGRQCIKCLSGTVRGRVFGKECIGFLIPDSGQTLSSHSFKVEWLFVFHKHVNFAFCWRSSWSLIIIFSRFSWPSRHFRHWNLLFSLLHRGILLPFSFTKLLPGTDRWRGHQPCSQFTDHLRLLIWIPLFLYFITFT